MSGCGVTEIPSIVSREFHPPGVGDRAPSARVCCKSRQIKRCCLWFQVGIFLTSPGVYVINYLTYAMRRPPKLPPDAKTQALREAGALHPHPDAVRDDAFLSHPFFDPRDRVQVKYEMVRRHRVDGRPVTEVAARFGVSRQTFYQTAAAFEAHGIPGLVPKRPGPKGAHKCTDAIVDYVERWRAGEDVQPDEPLTAAVARRFGTSVHARSLDRAVARRKKNRARRRPHESVGPRYRSGVPPVRGRAA